MENIHFNKESKEIAHQVVVIFGVNGDLSNRKLLPALFNLFVDNHLPPKFAVIGSGSDSKDDATFRDDVREGLANFIPKVVEKYADKVDDFLQLLHYQCVKNREVDDFKGLKEKIDTLCSECDIPQNVMYYFAIPPFLYEVVAQHLVAHQLNREENGWKRIIVEKPFGYSYDSAMELDKNLHQGFGEHQIYRIDHYLGKETVQNIMVTRFANGFFEPVWNRRYVDRVEITSVERQGVGSRGGYYDTAGVVRDMIQNHLLQVLAVIAMEPPAVFESTSIRNETVKILQAIRPIKAEEVEQHVVRGQYIQGVEDEQLLRGYRQEEGVSPNSKTETFVAMKLFIDNWRWGDVPFYIRTGKRMPERVTEVVIHLKPAPLQLFKERCISHSTNMIILRIHPDAGVAVDFGMKIPGAGYKVQNVNMAFHYADLTQSKIPEAYERLLLDAMTGDSTLYARADAVQMSWKLVDPILEAWKNNPDIPLYFYESNTWGPKEANELFGNKLITWKPPLGKFKTE